MAFDRRSILAAGLGVGAAGGAMGAHSRTATADEPLISGGNVAGLEPNAARDQTRALQAAIDSAAEKDQPVFLPPGIIRVSDLRLRRGARLIGAAGTSVLKFAGGPAFVTGDKADGLLLRDIVFDGAYQLIDRSRGEGLVSITNSRAIEISSIEIRESALGGLSLNESGGRVSHIRVGDALDFGIKSLDAAALDIAHSTISNCGNNGILVWRTTKGEDGTTITGNRVSHIRASAGGTGEFGNGINVFGPAVLSWRTTVFRTAPLRRSAAMPRTTSRFFQTVANGSARLPSIRNSVSKGH
jgi:uncharacterized secreted repeat protein (TIGR03808 family)